MNIYTILTFTTFMLLSLNIQAQNIAFCDEIKASTNNIAVTKNYVQRYVFPAILIFDTSKMPIQKKESKLVNDILDTYIHLDIDTKEKVKIGKKVKEKGANFYKSYLAESGVGRNALESSLIASGLSEMELTGFFTLGAHLRKLYKKYALTDITISRKETYDYLNCSNSYGVEPYFFSYFLYKIDIEKSKNLELNLANIEEIIGIMHTNNFERQISNFKKKRGWRKNIETWITVEPNYESDDFDVGEGLTVEMLSHLCHGDVIGPIYTKNKLLFFKVIGKKSRIKEEDIDIRVEHFFVKKYIKKGVANAMLNKQAVTYLDNIKNNKSNNFLYSIFLDIDFDIEFLNIKKTDPKIYNATKNLNKNDCTDILETGDAYHVFRVLNQEYGVNSDPYNIIYNNIITRKNNLAKNKYGVKEGKKHYKSIV
ncbi:MAG: hypothetical protein KDH96_06460 [Candidatus Riesia sp.]|nr:hypothetical protein [Candidatus Riesia sp.]